MILKVFIMKNCITFQGFYVYALLYYITLVMYIHFTSVHHHVQQLLKDYAVFIFNTKVFVHEMLYKSMNKDSQREDGLIQV